MASTSEGRIKFVASVIAILGGAASMLFNSLSWVLGGVVLALLVLSTLFLVPNRSRW